MVYRIAYDILLRIYREGTYIGQAINSIPEYKPAVTRMVYGVIERDYELDYILNQLAPKSPKPTIRILLKFGIYCLKYMDIASYAIGNNIVELARDINKGQYVSFVNAVMRKAEQEEYVYPEEPIELLAVTTSTPLWVMKKLVKQYGMEEAKEIASYKPNSREHIRINTKANEDDIKSSLNIIGTSPVGGYYIRRDERLQDLLDNGDITYQSPSSMLVAQLAVSNNPDTILDCCSAPGGKSVYMAELSGAHITACDIHEHRLELINKYALRMGVSELVEINNIDASKLNEAFISKFDTVLCDVPCSGVGVRYSKPDILLRREEKDIGELANLQSDILEVNANYVKQGGLLIYSTCTLFYEENERVVERFLAKNSNFICEIPKNSLNKSGKFIKLLPHIDNTDGFFIAVMRCLL